MTDTELLDGLQRLFMDNVAVLRTCRSGVKIELGRGDYTFADIPLQEPHDFRQFFGGDASGSEHGPDIRTAIRRALEAE